MKYKALIADDEMLARYSLQTLISRNLDSLSVAGEAENGRQAVEMAEKIRPHIIIMDIKMPGINGLEASQCIREFLPDAVIIILSAHDDFIYAQKALNSGFDAYMLKPFKKEEILNLLKEKIALLDRRGIPELDPQLICFLEEEYIAYLIGDQKEDDFDKLIQNHLGYSPDRGIFLILGRDSFTSDEKNTITSVFGKTLTCITSDRTGSGMTIFLSGENLPAEKQILDDLILANLNKLKRVLNRPLYCGVGITGKGRSGMERSFREAFSAYQSCRGKQEILFYSHGISPSEKRGTNYTGEKELSVLECLRKRDFDRARDLLIELIEIICRLEELDNIKEKSAELLMILLKTAREMGCSDREDHRHQPISRIFAMNCSIEIKEYLRSTLLNIIDSLQSREGDSDWWLERAFAYLRKNLYKDISLESIADEIHMSPQHLSRIFKVRYSQTIVEYITDQRISYARYLLQSSRMPIKDISGKIGYRDQNYFSRVFKKQTGLTPSQFRDSVQ